MYFETFYYKRPSKHEKRKRLNQERIKAEKDILTDEIKAYLQPRFPDINFSFIKVNDHYHVYADDKLITNNLPEEYSVSSEIINNFLDAVWIDDEINRSIFIKYMIDKEIIYRLLKMGEEDVSGVKTVSDIYDKKDNSYFKREKTESFLTKLRRKIGFGFEKND